MADLTARLSAAIRRPGLSPRMSASQVVRLQTMVAESPHRQPKH